MPVSPRKPCSFPGCGALVSSGSRCDSHRVQAYRQQNAVRYKSGETDAKDKNRFYQRVEWKRIRASQLESFPRCRRCGAVATHVDHVRDFKNSIDPLAVDPANLQSLCRPCHTAKTFGRGGGG